MLGPYPLDSIITGDARQLAQAIPDVSVDLVLTDPVYWQIEDYAWLAETAARILKPNKSVIAFVGHLYTIPAGAAMLPYLQTAPVLEHYVGGSVGRLFSHSIQCNVLPALWFSKGSPDNDWMALQELSTPVGIRGHDWGKAQDMAYYRISKFTKPGEIVLDPFCGGGSTPAMCKILERRYLAFEIDPATADKARARVADTLPLLDGLDNKEIKLTRSWLDGIEVDSPDAPGAVPSEG